MRIGDALVGLVADRIRSVLRAPDSAIGPVPAVLNRGAGEAQIDSIYRAEGGGRLISILSPEHLFQDETTARILADGRQRRAESMARKRHCRSRTLRCVSPGRRDLWAADRRGRGGRPAA
ncbi:MAG: hypothetical protein WDN69_06970 [Aliidongia sp.]